ncbi:neuronal acetylcholine receptor subunit alpha-6-like [Argopecten irradians]|uniref:neuronal acetylcholine receptor subunit alpha-6-like n=1 Tax=Argopecten irradians TaxID=31199 RepID=UPI003712DF1B
MYFYLPGLVALVLLRLVIANNSTMSTKLYTDLLSNYEKNVRPGINFSIPTFVQREFTLIAFNGFKEIDSKVSIIATFAIFWNDNRLTWNPNEYGGTTSTLIPADLLWKPDIAITNSYGGIQFLYRNEFSIRVLHNGTMVMYTGDNYDLYCNADITFYPLDKQTCDMQMMTWGSFPNEVTFYGVDADSLHNVTTSDPTWDVTEVKMFNRVNIQLTKLTVRIKLKRLPEYVVINMILPVCFLCVINIFVFFLPVESGERIGFSITLLLSVAVFMTILSDSLPQSSRPKIAVLCYFMFSQLLLSIFMMVFTIVGLRIYWANPQRQIPVYLKLFSRIMGTIYGCQCCKRRKLISIIEPESGEDGCDKKRVKEHDQNNQKVEELLTWQKVANDFDNFCIVFFTLLISISTVVFCVNLIENPEG